MQLPSPAIFMNILAESSSSNSSNARTSWAQTLKQRPQPIQSYSSMDLMNWGVHSCLFFVSAVM
jgi:hypothetical protein